jgi:hypothetical protein
MSHPLEKMVETVADRIRQLEAQLAVRTQERDDWRLSFETTNEAVGKVDDEVAALRAACQALAVKMRDHKSYDSDLGYFAPIENVLEWIAELTRLSEGTP